MKVWPNRGHFLKSRKMAALFELSFYVADAVLVHLLEYAVSSSRHCLIELFIFILRFPQMRSAVSSRNPCHPRQRKRGDHEAKRNGGVERSETVPEESSRRSEAR